MKIVYQDKIVAFIDVLGFSNLVYSENTSSINKYFEYVLNNFKLAAKANKFDYYLISDSIVLSAKRTQQNLKKIVKTLCTLQRQCLYRGILLRGAISYGGLYQNKSNNILVGTGLINAYKLEAKAIFPRIILDRRFIKDYYPNTDLAIKDLEWVLYKSPLGYQSDYLYLNYGSMFVLFTNVLPEIIKNLLKFIEIGYFDNDHIAKYEWLKNHLISSLKKSIDYHNKKGNLQNHQKRNLARTEQALLQFELL